MYKFDHNWFAQSEQNLQFLFHGKQNEEINILEIGAFEGMSTVWFLENLLNCHVTTIDTWDGGIDHNGIDFKKVEENFRHNIAFHKDRVEVIKNNSFDGLIKLYLQNRKFDFIYIDGSHTARDVMNDLVLSFKLLNVGGAFYCDDYLWGFNDPRNGNLNKNIMEENFVFDTPKIGIDNFVNTYANKLRPIAVQCVGAAYFKVKE